MVAAYPWGMSLSQPSRTIVVEPVQGSMTAPAPVEPTPGEPPERVEAPAAPAVEPARATAARP
jgi:hypothetical protein